MRHRRSSCLAALSVLAAAATTLAPVGAADAVIPLKNAAIIARTDAGYRYQAGQQDSHLVVTRVKAGLRFVDTGTAELRSLPASCDRRSVPRGIAAVCKVPGSTSARNPLLVEIWPRLGNDFIDASTLSASFRLSVLADAGRDVVRTGAGNDFVNGAQNGDRVSGGAGNDWIRTGKGDDTISGGPGKDRLVGVDGSDTIRGGDGDDRVGGGPGDDKLYADAGHDVVACGGGRDYTKVSRTDKISECESVSIG